MKRQRTIGVLTPFLGGNYYTEVIQGIQVAAKQLHTNLIIIRTGGKYFDVPIGMDNVDGWLIINFAVEDHFLKQLEEMYQKPVVTVAKNIRHLEMNGGMVVVDNKQAAFDAVLHLYQHGHKKIGYIGSMNMDDMKYRYEGYMAAMRYLNLEIEPQLVYTYGDMTVFGGRQIAEQIIKNNFPMTAAVVCTDICAFGMIEKFLDKGYQVPEDMALIGFDNSSSSRHGAVSISSIDQNIRGTMYRAIENLVSRIEEPTPFQLDVLPCHLITRQSCGCTEAHMEEQVTETSEYANHINALRTENNVNYEFNRYILSYQFTKIKDMAGLLENYFNWGALTQHQGYNDLKQPKLVLKEYYNFNDNKSELKQINLHLYATLQSNPPLFSSQGYSTDNEIVYVLPYRLTQNNWSLLSFGTSHEKTEQRATEYMRIVHLFDIVANTFDRIALLDEASVLNDKHQSLKERHDVITRLTDDIMFEIDFASREVWLNRNIQLEVKPTTLLGLEDVIHPEDIMIVRKQFYDHFRDNKPFYAEIRARASHGQYYRAIINGESTRDHVGNIQKLIGSIRDLTKQRINNDLDELGKGVMNRRRFYEEIKQVIQEGNSEFALCVLDIDNFKLINDLYGHQVGDDIIDELSVILTQCIKPNDHISRFGGDEFVILFQYKQVDEVDQFANYLFDTISTKLVGYNADINLSVSIGISLYPSDGQEYDELLKKADIALYQVKHNGKNNFLRFESYMVHYQQDKRKMEKLLRDALVSDQFVLVYQPQVYARSKRIYGVEVLLRLKTESGVILTPDKFIPVAESSGLIVPIGAWVIRAACMQGMEWIKLGYEPVKISINISGLQLKSIQFLSTVKAILDETGMNPAHLTFEITETTIIDHSSVVLNVIEEIRKLGISVAIDDFGISYSSLSVLKNFPIEILKIDKSFVREMVTDEKGYKIVNAIVNIAKSLDLKIVAEGVEDCTQLELLGELGCQFIQGYYISKPVGRDEIIQFLPNKSMVKNTAHMKDSIRRDGVS